MIPFEVDMNDGYGQRLSLKASENRNESVGFNSQPGKRMMRNPFPSLASLNLEPPHNRDYL